MLEIRMGTWWQQTGHSKCIFPTQGKFLWRSIEEEPNFAVGKMI